MTSIEDILLEKIDVLSNALVEEQRKNQKASDDINDMIKRYDDTLLDLRSAVLHIEDLESALSDKEGIIYTQYEILEDKKLHRSCQDRDKVIGDIGEVVKEFRAEGLLANGLCGMQKVSDLFDEWMNSEPTHDAMFSDLQALVESNNGFRAKVVDLHTEVQDLKGEVERLNHVLSDRLQTINSLKHMCQSSDDERLVDETSDVVVKVAFLEMP